MQKTDSGEITYYDPQGKAVDLLGKSPREIKKLGISLSFVPEDRLGMGLVGSMGMTENMMLKSYNDGHTPFVETFRHRP